MLKPHSPTPETAAEAIRETPVSTPAQSSSSRSTAAPALPVHPNSRHTKPEESLPPLSRSHPHPVSRFATTRARTTPNHSPARKLHSSDTHRVKENPETSTLPH